MHFDWPTAFWAITQEPEFCQIWDLNYFQEKLKIICLNKSRKTYFGAILSTSGLNLCQNEFFWKKGARSVFKYSDKKSRRNKETFLRKMWNWWTGSSRQWFYSTLHRREIQLKSVHPSSHQQHSTYKLR